MKIEVFFLGIPTTRFKCGRIASSAIDAAASLVVAGINNASQAAISDNTNKANIAMNDATNATNKQIADDANELQYQMHQEDMNFNAEQAQIQREWDSAGQQRQRLVEAGLNPNLMNGSFGASSGSAASAPASSPVNVAQMNPATLNPMQFQPLDYNLLESLSGAIGLKQQNADLQKTAAETAGIELRNRFDASTFDTREAALIAANNQVIEMTKALKIGNKHARIINPIIEETQRLMRDTIQREFDERDVRFMWASQLQQATVDKISAEVDKIRREIQSMDVTDELARSQIELNKDNSAWLQEQTHTSQELTPVQVKELKYRIFNQRIQNALDVLNVPRTDRKFIARALSDPGNSQNFFRELRKVTYDHNVSPIWKWFHSFNLDSYPTPDMDLRDFNDMYDFSE